MTSGRYVTIVPPCGGRRCGWGRRACIPYVCGGCADAVASGGARAARNATTIRFADADVATLARRLRSARRGATCCARVPASPAVPFQRGLAAGRAIVVRHAVPGLPRDGACDFTNRAAAAVDRAARRDGSRVGHLRGCGGAACAEATRERYRSVADVVRWVRVPVGDALAVAGTRGRTALRGRAGTDAGDGARRRGETDEAQAGGLHHRRHGGRRQPDARCGDPGGAAHPSARHGRIGVVTAQETFRGEAAGVRPSRRVAVVGSGLAGLSTAWMLAPRHDVTLFERDARIGGQCHTIRVDEVPVDTGLVAYDAAASPNLAALFWHLGMATEAADMSRSVSIAGGQVEYADTDLRGLFAQKRNLLRPRFLAMLADTRRFHRIAERAADTLDERTTLGEWLVQAQLGEAFRDDHLLPLASATWSASGGDVLAECRRGVFLAFHRDQRAAPPARPVRPGAPVTGGAQGTVAALLAGGGIRVRRGAAIVGLRHTGNAVSPARCARPLARVRRRGARLLTRPRRRRSWGSGAARARRGVGSRSAPPPTAVVVHRDRRAMPRQRAAWASWNVAGRRRPGAAPERHLLDEPAAEPAARARHVRDAEPGCTRRYNAPVHAIDEALVVARHECRHPRPGRGREPGAEAGLGVAGCAGRVARRRLAGARGSTRTRCRQGWRSPRRSAARPRPWRVAGARTRRMPGPKLRARPAFPAEADVVRSALHRVT